MKLFRLIFFLVLLSIIEFGNGSIGYSFCKDLYNSHNDVWVLGEVPYSSSFAAQLHSIFSFAPVAKTLQSNLVVSHLNVHPAFNRTGSWNMTKAPFSTFFDLDHFTSYWSKLNVTVIPVENYSSCFRNQGKPEDHHLFSQMAKDQFIHSQINLTRVPEFYPHKSDNFSVMLYYANTTSYERFQFPFPNHSLVKLQSRYAFTSLFSFWDELSTLHHVYASLKPPPWLDRLAKLFFQSLPPETIIINFRVDDDAFRSIENTQSAELEIHKKLMRGIVLSDCFSHLFLKQSNVFPPVYVMSNYNPQGKNERKRAKRITEDLHKLGIKRIITRRSLFDSISNSRPLAVPLMQLLSYEHYSYIEMLMAKSCQCFVHAGHPSIASYMIKRFRNIDKQIHETYESINEKTYLNLYQYRNWGF